REMAGLRTLPEETMQVVRGSKGAPPIDALRMACATLSLDVADPNDISPGADLQDGKMLTARFPTILAAHARLSAGKEPIPPREDFSPAANFLYMVQGRDPRAEVFSRVADEMSSAHLEDRKLFDLARAVEQIALKVLEEHKPGRNLKTNVEFYTALVLQSLGLQPRSFVAMFACGRVAGWCAHVIEQHAEDHLIRPQSEYVGPRGLKTG